MTREVPLFHWTDIAAQNIVRSKGKKKEYIVESGITPSGVVHLGNFREAITQDLVKKALERQKQKVKYLYVWDDYDTFRKVPSNLPQQEMLVQHLHKPVFKVPDPFGCHANYALHFQKLFEAEMERVGVTATYIYNHEPYLKCAYAEEIKIALENTEKIKEILNQFREEPLTADWLPIFIFCEKCDKDTTTLQWKGGYLVSYTCECKHKDTIDFRKKGIVTLRWRVDWPMRWHKNKVDFESAGKDHFASGGSVDTGRQIQQQIFHSEPPFGIMYEWIGIKGKGQFASSSGNVITLTEMLEVYEPEIVRYLFAGTRPNKEFSISFDADVLAIYEDYDQCERIYYGEVKVNDKEKTKNDVAYELSQIRKIAPKIPYQPSFRHLTMLLQIYSFDVEKVIAYFERELQNKRDQERLRTRAICAAHWIKKHAPEEFRFTLQEKCQVTLAAEEKKILRQLAQKLLEREWTDKDLHEEMYILCKNNNFEPKDFFRIAYSVLINKDKGPRLASFLLEIGREKTAALLKRV